MTVIVDTSKLQVERDKILLLLFPKAQILKNLCTILESYSFWNLNKNGHGRKLGYLEIFLNLLLQKLAYLEICLSLLLSEACLFRNILKSASFRSLVILKYSCVCLFQKLEYLKIFLSLLLSEVCLNGNIESSLFLVEPWVHWNSLCKIESCGVII